MGMTSTVLARLCAKLKRTKAAPPRHTAVSLVRSYVCAIIAGNALSIQRSFFSVRYVTYCTVYDTCLATVGLPNMIPTSELHRWASWNIIRHQHYEVLRLENKHSKTLTVCVVLGTHSDRRGETVCSQKNNAASARILFRNFWSKNLPRQLCFTSHFSFATGLW